MRKMKSLALGLLVFFLFSGQNMINAENPQISDRNLFLAIQGNNLKLFQSYLGKNANWHATDGRGNTLIHAVIAPEIIALAEPEAMLIEENRGVVKRSQKEAINSVSMPMSVVESPRVHAVKPIEMHIVRGSSGTMNNSLQMRMDIIRRLVGRGADINRTNGRGETPLILAVRKARLEDDERPEVSQVFFTAKNFGGIYKGIDPDLTPFLPFFRLLLNLGADPRLRDARERTPIFYATEELFPLLLQHGAALEDRDKDGLTPFLYAKTKTALALLSLGSDPQAMDSLKRNRWHYMDVNLWEELAKKLSELRVNINQQDKDGRTPLLICCQKEYLQQVNLLQIKFLLEHGADISLADNLGQTPLLAATRGNNLNLMEWFLGKGAPVNVCDRYGNSPLLISRFSKIKVELLLRYKADPNIQNNSGNTILHLLADGGHPEALDLLSLCIKNGAAVNHRNNEGATPLLKAFNHVDLKIMKLLLENGADPNILVADNKTLLDLAEMGGRKEAITLLRRYGAQYNRSWFDRHPQALLIGYAFLGIFPLFTFLFSLNKPSFFTKRLLWFFLVPVGFGVLMVLVYLTGGYSSGGGEGFLVLFLAIPPLIALLMSLSGTRALADRCPPGLGIPLSFLNAVGCMGLTFGIMFIFLIGPHGEGGILLVYDALFGGGAAAVITLLFAFVVWKKRLASLKNTDSSSQSDEIQDELLK
jgi:ankyrin repeat protein